KYFSRVEINGNIQSVCRGNNGGGKRMGVYSFPILIAVLILFLIAVHTAIPWLIYTYRKYGYFSFWSTFIILTFIFYALSAYFLVILLLPYVRDICVMQSADA